MLIDWLESGWQNGLISQRCRYKLIVFCYYPWIVLLLLWVVAFSFGVFSCKFGRSISLYLPPPLSYKVHIPDLHGKCPFCIGNFFRMHWPVKRHVAIPNLNLLRFSILSVNLDSTICLLCYPIVLMTDLGPLVWLCPH